MDHRIASLVVVLSLSSLASLRADPVRTADPAKSDVAVLAERLQKAGAAAPESEVIRLLTLARDAGQPFRAVDVAKVYLGQAAKPSAAVWGLAAENAWLTADYRTAVARYKTYLRAAPADADRRAVARMVSIQVDLLRDKEDAYRSINELRDQYRSPALRRFDTWFLSEAQQRRDFAGMGRLLSVAFSEKQPIEQERYYYWRFLDWALDQVGGLTNPGDVGGVFLKLAGTINNAPARALQCAFLGNALEFRAGRVLDVGPSLAAARAWLEVKPTAETLRSILSVMVAGGAPEWEKQADARREFFQTAFGKLGDSDRGAILRWPSSRTILTPLQWTELAGKYPVPFRNPDNHVGLSFYVPNADAAVIKRQAQALAGIPNRSAAVIGAAASSDDFAACCRALVRNDGYYLPAQDMDTILNGELWSLFKALHADNPALASDQNRVKALAAVGGELIASTPVALFDIAAAHAYVQAVWQTSPDLDRTQVIAALNSLEWVPWSESVRKRYLSKSLTGLLRSYESSVTASKDATAEAARGQLPALKDAVSRILSGSSADPSKAPNPLCRGVAQVTLALSAGNVEQMLAGARAVYPLVRDYDVKKTPFGAVTLAHILQTPSQKAGTAAFHADVIADQAGQLDLTQWPSRFQSVITAMGSRHRYGRWDLIPKDQEADAKSYQAAFGKLLTDMSARNQFSPPLFDHLRAVCVGSEIKNQDVLGAVIDKLITSKVLVQTAARPNEQIRSATVSYMWMVSGCPPLAAKYPVESAFDDLFVEEALKTGYLDDAYWRFGGQDKQGKIAGVAAKVLAGFETLPLGYDARPIHSREALGEWHDRALGTAPLAREALLSAFAAAAGKGRFDEVAIGRGWFAAVGQSAKRGDIFAKIDAFVQISANLPARPALSNLGLGRVAKADNLTGAELETLRRLVCDAPPATWWGCAGMDDVVKLTVPSLASQGNPADFPGFVAEYWRLAAQTQNPQLLRYLADWAEATLKEGASDRAAAISSAGLAILDAGQSPEFRAGLMTVRSQGLGNTGGAISVDRNDPR